MKCDTSCYYHSVTNPNHKINNFCTRKGIDLLEAEKNKADFLKDCSVFRPRYAKVKKVKNFSQ